MIIVQPGILASVPALSRYLFFEHAPEARPREALARLGQAIDGDSCVVGLGQSLLRRLGTDVSGLKDFPSYSGEGVEVPSTPAALWCWLRGDDRGDLVHQTRQIQKLVAPALQLTRSLDAFRYRAGLDLTGYEDGTENPEGTEAREVGLVSGQGLGKDGSSFAAVQQWVHDLDHFESMAPERQDHTIGRRRSDNEEIEDAPDSAHVKRTAQESFEPEAFVLRRSMPWSNGSEDGLVFVAFGNSLDAFESLLKRMVGAEDGITDALFNFTRPVTGAYFWCPPVREGQLDLTVLGL